MTEPNYEVQAEKGDCDEEYAVYELGVYGSSSVLEGQCYRSLVERYYTLDAAKEQYPLVVEVEPYRMEPARVPTFDPNPERTAEFGECWDEY